MLPVGVLKRCRVNMPRTIIFSQHYVECAQMYSKFEELLGRDFMEPPNAPNMVNYRLVDMYTQMHRNQYKYH